VANDEHVALLRKGVARVADEHVVDIVRHVGPVPTNPVEVQAYSLKPILASREVALAFGHREDRTPSTATSCRAKAAFARSIVAKRLGSRYRSGRSKDWLKFKNPEAPAVKREAEEEWGC
jgi:hypothetical protein